MALIASAAAHAEPVGRAYELVSPPEKYNGGVVFGQRASADGEAVGFVMNGAIGGNVGAYALAPYVARRTESGWETRSAAPPIRSEHRGSSEVNALPADFTGDLTGVFLPTNDWIDPDDDEPLASGDLTMGFDIYKFEPATNLATWLSRPEPAVAADYRAGGGLSVRYLGRSRDSSRVFFTTNHRLLSQVPAVVSDGTVYEWADGQVRLVAIDDADNAVANARLAGAVGALAEAGGSEAISDDGSRVLWQRSGGSPLYMREDGQRTLMVSASRRTGSVGTPANATFVGAARDGSVVYFQSSGRLTDDAPSAGIYRYERADESLRFIARSGINQPAATSADGSRLYFGATQALLPEAQANQRNLYLWNNGELKLVAVTSTTAVTNDPRLRVSRDGRYAAFTTMTSLDPRHRTGVSAIYIYDAETGRVACASCRPDGEVGTHDARFRMSRSRYTLSVDAQVVLPRNITSDGKVYFETSEQLVGNDINGAVDVYEFDDGKVALISSGTGDGAELADNSEDGSSVFFFTPERLAPTDRDGGFPDLYVARVGGGFPYDELGEKRCQGDNCQGAPSSPPTIPVPGSALVEPDGSPDDPEPTNVSFRPLRPTASQLRAFARTGRIVLRVRVGSGGTVMATAQRVVRRGQRAAGRGWATISRRGTAKVTVELNRATRRALARTGKTRLRLTVRHSASDQTRRITVRLATKARRGASRGTGRQGTR